MISKLANLFRTPDLAAEAGREDAAIHLAAAALMVEAAHMDGQVDAAERSAIARCLEAHFGLSETEAGDLLAKAEAEIAESTQLHPFALRLTGALDYDERVELVEMLWEVAYADGELHDFEANLLRRLGGLLHVTDFDRGAARKRAVARLAADIAPDDEGDDSGNVTR